ncbi:MAG: outer membrane protein assembly factor BamA [Maritimibacter sp.]
MTAAIPTLAVAQSYSFTSVQIEGLNRIEANTVLAHLGFARGESVSAAQLNDAYQRLNGSGLFEKVVLTPRGSTLVVKVTELPMINRINIEGNHALKDDQLTALLSSKPRYVYNPAIAEQDAQAIAEAYQASGRIAATVTPKIIRRDEGRVDLVFEVAEGKNTEIERINFNGNRAFSDARLKRVISSKQAGLLRFLVQADTLDPARVQFDKQLIADFYTARGYPDIDVVAVTSEVSPQEDAAYVTYQIREGQQFSFGEISAASTVEGIDAATLEPLAHIRTGSTFSPTVLDRAVARMEKKLQQMGYGFARVDPKVTRNDREGTLDIAFTVVRGARIVVERIDIQGNTTTLDRVVRQQFNTVEGDPFNPRAIRAAAERIRALGYFSNVDVQAREGSQADAVVVDVNVEEQGTGSFSAGGTYSFGTGFGYSLSFTETNFLGRGQYFKIAFTGGLDQKNYALAFSEPNLFGRDLNVGFNLNYSETTWASGLFESRTGEATGFIGFPVNELSRVRFFAGGNVGTMFNYTGTSAILQAEAARGWQYGVHAGMNVDFDTRRNGLNDPTFMVAKFSGDFGGFGSDNQYFKGTAQANVSTQLGNSDITLAGTVEGGALISIGGNGSRLIDRFALSTDQLLGFGPLGVGPRDTGAADNDALGGNYYGVARVEAKFPLGLPEEYGIQGGVFAHAGTVWGLDHPGGVDDAMHIRASAGAAIYWASPLGPLRFSYAYPLMKESYDEEQRFGISISAGF